MTKAKTVNYTAEQTAELVAAYIGAENPEGRAAVVAAMAESFGKSAASIRAKLVREKVYIKPVNTGKKNGLTKGDLVERISELTETPADVLDSLSKATMFALNRIVETLEDSRSNYDELLESTLGNPVD